MTYLTQFRMCIAAVTLAVLAVAVTAADFDLDPTFGTQGVVQSNLPAVLAMAVQPDGKIVSVGGGFVARHDPDGSIDTTFGTEGVVLISGDLWSVALQSDGKIVAGGNILVGSTGESFRYDFLVARFNVDGSPDTTFSEDGFNTIHNSDRDFGKSLVILPDGKIIFGGTGCNGNINFVCNYVIFRLHSTGGLDDSYGLAGQVIVNNGGLNGISLQPDDKLVATGSAGTFRYRPTGTLDPSFGVSGKIGQVGGAIALTTNGRILVSESEELFRYNSDGSLDTTFGTSNGHSTVNTNIGHIRLLSNGKIVVIGAAGIARFHPDGLPDLVYRPIAIPGLAVNAIGIQSDDKVVVGGHTVTSEGQFSSLARLGGPRRSAAQFDFDGDGRTDASVFRSGIWYINPSTDPNTYYGQQWGVPTDKLVPADYDGDGKTDIAVWRLSGADGTFYILESATSTFRVEQSGGPDFDPQVVGDWDGDGKADLAFYFNGQATGDPSFFSYRSSSQGSVVTIQWGVSGDEPLRGDYDGDGKLDAAVYRASDNIWYILQSSDNQVRYVYSGGPANKRVSGDFDGDGKTDIAIFHDGAWAVLQSSNNEGLYAYWGLGTDELVPGDYDGDGRTDFAVWRDGDYWILDSSTSHYTYRHFGLAGDKPIASVFMH